MLAVLSPQSVVCCSRTLKKLTQAFNKLLLLFNKRNKTTHKLPKSATHIKHLIRGVAKKTIKSWFN